jgi:hypothetical protein
MTTTKDITAKFAIAAVAVAMIFSAYAPAASAQTTLQEQITALLEQIQMLETQLGGVSTPDSMSAVCPYTWTRDLTMGSEGADVMKLQQFLNETPDLRVGVTGAGSAGMETMYYGPATAAAVSKMQVMFRAEVLTPGGLVNPTGYFGPSSRAKANSLCVAAPVSEEEEEEATEEEEEEETAALSDGGTLVTFEIDDSEDNVQEGAEDEVVMELTAEAENGDVELSRLTLQLIADEDNAPVGEVDPWDVFEEVSLWVDGDKVASFDASDEDDYLREDDGTFRFSDLGLILREDEEVEMLVAVSVQNSVDGTAANAAWNIDVISARTFDADGVAETASYGEMGIDNEATQDGAGVFAGILDGINFDVTEAGTDDGADLEGNSDTPDAMTLLVDEDADDSDEFVVHILDIEVDRDSSDLELGDAYVDVTITNANPAVAIAGGQRDVVDGIFMKIDGETIEGEATTGAADVEATAIALNGGTTTVRYLFEFDQDVTLDSDEDYTVEISMVFKGQDGEYVNGVTVQTDVDGSLWEVEGVENDNELSGTDESELHTLATVVPVISGTDFNVERSEDGNSGTISFEFNLEADGDNDVSFAFGDVTDVDNNNDGLSTEAVVYTITGGDLGANATASISKISGDATLVGDTWTVNDGDDATFVLDVTFDAVSTAGAYRVFMDTIAGVEIDMTSTALNI